MRKDVGPNKQKKVGSTDYEKVADKVGFVPNIRKWDNIFQAAMALGFALIGFVLGAFTRDMTFAIIYALLGFIAGGLLAGFVLMIVGLVRK